MRPLHNSGRERKEIEFFMFYSKYKRNSWLLRDILDERWKTYGLLYPFTSYAEVSVYKINTLKVFLKRLKR